MKLQASTTDAARSNSTRNDGFCHRIKGWCCTPVTRRLSDATYCYKELVRIRGLTFPKDKTNDEYKLRSQGLYRLRSFERDVTDKPLLEQDWTLFFEMAVANIMYFQERSGNRQCFRLTKEKRNFDLAQMVYEKILARTVPQNQQKVMVAIITAISDSAWWGKEYECKEIFDAVVRTGVTGFTFVTCILDHVDKVLTAENAMEARLVIRVLYNFLESYKWPKLTRKGIDTVSRLLSMYRCSIHRGEDCLIDYTPISRGLVVCARRIFENADNYDLLTFIEAMAAWSVETLIPDDSLLDFGNILEYAAMRHRTNLYQETMTTSLLGVLLSMVASDRRLVSLLGNRVLHSLLDRHDNKRSLQPPRLFYENTRCGVVVAEYNTEDKSHIRVFRQAIHDAFLKAVVTHGNNYFNLESVYTSICMMIVEVPCGYTAATSVSLAMSIQDAALTNDTIQPIVKNHFHAVVIAIMTLLCWTHKAQDFYKYVNEIIQRRADDAPHLNPPLRAVYKYAQHHVRWNKPILFFETWEVRYGLYQHFKPTKDPGSSTNVGSIVDETQIAAVVEELGIFTNKEKKTS